MPHITIAELLERNKNFAGPGHIPRPLSTEQTQEPAHTIVISCFDPRAVPEEFFQVNPRDREIVSIRNAGGHTKHCAHDIVTLDDILRIDDVLVIHHTDCGLTHTTEDRIRKRLRDYVPQGSDFDFESFDFGCMTNETLASSCREDVEYLKKHPWIRADVNIVGFLYDIKTGLLHEV